MQEPENQENKNHLSESKSGNNSDDEIIDWEKEAAAIIRDVKNHVKEIFVSRNLTSNNFRIFLNIETLESKKFCVQVSDSGFLIIGNDYDKTDLCKDNPDDYYETPYALLTKISEGYVESFANRLSQQMSTLIKN